MCEQHSKRHSLPSVGWFTAAKLKNHLVGSKHQETEEMSWKVRDVHHTTDNGGVIAWPLSFARQQEKYKKLKRIAPTDGS